MTSLEHRILLMLRQANTESPDIYQQFDEVTDTHIRQTMKKLQDAGLVRITDRIKRAPGEAGRPVNQYGLTQSGQDELSQYEQLLRQLR